MKRTWIVLLILVAIFLCTAYFVLYSTSGEYYRTYSPNRQFSVYASRYFYERHMPRMPGQAGDAAGKVYLYDELTKKVIANAHIPMLWLTEGIIWENGKAYFKDADYPSASNPWVLPVRDPELVEMKKEITDIDLYDSFDSVGNDKIKCITIMVYGGDMGVSETYAITKDSVHYDFYLATDTTKNTATSRVNTTEKWESLLENVDMNAFKELINGRTYQMANGTDTDIIITTENSEYIKTNAHDNKAWDNIYSEFRQQVK